VLTKGKTLVAGQLLPATIASETAGGRILQLSLDHSILLKSQLTEASNVASILPGHLVNALVTAVVPSGLNVRICGFFDGTIDLTHLDLKGEDIDEKYKIGKKVSLLFTIQAMQLTSDSGKNLIRQSVHFAATIWPLRAPSHSHPFESSHTRRQDTARDRRANR